MLRRLNGLSNAIPIVSDAFLETYGTKPLVSEYAASILAAIKKYHRQDIRIEVFGHFLSEFWDLKTLSIFLTAFEKLSEPSKTPCLELPSDYTKSCISFLHYFKSR